MTVFTGKCIAALAISLVMRMLVTFLLMAGNKLTNKEKAFVAIAWLPKATVQVLNFTCFFLGESAVFVIYFY
jgi:hypothetical protein